MSGALAAIDTGGLRQLVRRAADALAGAETAAAILDARDLAQAAYDAAKTAGRLARTKGAHDDLMARVYRLQADAAEIEFLTKKRLADEYDAAQARGEVGRSGARTDLVPAGNEVVPSAADLGLTRKEIYEARQVRDVIAERPETLRHVIEDVLASGDEPTKARLRQALGVARPAGKANIGTASRSREDRANDAYFTPPEAMRVLLALESFSAIVKEPACGRGHISKLLEDAGYGVMLADLVDYGTADKNGELQQVGDFLDSRADGSEGVDMVTNPPYGRHILNRFIAHALREHKPRKIALLMNLNVLCGCEDEDRLFYMDEQPPSRIYVFSRRLPMMHQDGWDGPESASQMNTAWYVWERNADGAYGEGFPRIIRVDYQKFASAAPLAPGEGGFAPPPMRFVEGDDEEDFARETPRKSEAERVEEERAAALVWMAARRSFSEKEFQVGFAIRPLIAARIVETMLAEGLVERWVDGLRVSAAGGRALEVTAQAHAAGMSADDVRAFGEVAA